MTTHSVKPNELRYIHNLKKMIFRDMYVISRREQDLSEMQTSKMSKRTRSAVRGREGERRRGGESGRRREKRGRENMTHPPPRHPPPYPLIKCSKTADLVLVSVQESYWKMHYLSRNLASGRVGLEEHTAFRQNAPTH